MKYELVVVWATGEREVFSFNNAEDAEFSKHNMEMAFGSQLWCCVNRKQGKSPTFFVG